MKRIIVCILLLGLSVGFCNAQQKENKGYEKLNQELLATDSFWKFIRRGNFPTDMTSIVIGQNVLTQAITIFQYIQGTLAWDGTYGILPTKELRQTLLAKEGSVADINLILCSLYRQCGFDAFPVILNTEGWGELPENPEFKDFNYVVCIVEVEGSFLLCDATAKTPLGLLPMRCLNRLGWLVNEEGGEMIDLTSVGKDQVYVSTLIKASGNTVKQKVAIVEKEYAALRTLEKVAKIGELGQKEEVKALFPEWNFTKFKYDSGANIDSKEFAMRRKTDNSREIHIHPLLTEGILNPVSVPDFSGERVVFPVKIIRNSHVEMEIPKGYTVVLPETVEERLAKNGALLRFQAMENMGKAIVVFTFTLDKQVYLPEEYEGLKAFLQDLDKVYSTELVLKAKN